jgi:hypothetical protein
MDRPCWEAVRAQEDRLMSAATLTAASLITVQQQFEASLPAMERVLEHFARSWPERNRDDMLADARGALWSAWHSLVRRGKDPVKVGVTGIAALCCRFVRSGRKLGNRTRGRACMDVLDHRAQHRLGLKIVGLDDHAETESAAGSASWRQWLTQRNVATPAEQACFRLDFGRWMAEELPERKRQMAELLAEGHETGVVAKMLGVTPAAVSQSRAWLESSWRAFQNEPAPAQATPGPRPVVRPRKVDGRAQRRRGQRAAQALVEAGA